MLELFKDAFCSRNMRQYIKIRTICNISDESLRLNLINFNFNFKPGSKTFIISVSI